MSATTKPKKKQVPVGPRLHVGMLSNRVLLAKNVWAEPHGDGTATFHVRGEQIDVTDQFAECARDLKWSPPGEVGLAMDPAERDLLLRALAKFGGSLADHTELPAIFALAERVEHTPVRPEADTTATDA